MRTTIHSNVRTAACFSLLLVGTLNAAAQIPFQNLGFEITTLTVFITNPYGPYYTTNATVPGWDWSPHFNAGYGDQNTTVSLNNIALDSPAVTLQGTNGFIPALSGKYSILLQGGSQYFPAQYSGGASIFNTRQIPVSAQSLIYLGNASLQVSFNGQALSPFALENTPTYTKWGIDISPYAGQTGELRFAVPRLAYSMLDGIQFSTSPIPEPSASLFSVLGFIVLAAFTRSPKKLSAVNSQSSTAACL